MFGPTLPVSKVISAYTTSYSHTMFLDSQDCPCQLHDFTSAICPIQVFTKFSEHIRYHILSQYCSKHHLCQLLQPPVTHYSVTVVAQASV